MLKSLFFAALVFATEMSLSNGQNGSELASDDSAGMKINRALLTCGGKPERCDCELRIHKGKIRCDKMNSCTCKDGREVDLTEDVVLTADEEYVKYYGLFIEGSKRAKRFGVLVSTVCDGRAPESCTCFSPDDEIQFPLVSPISTSKCHPNKCLCSDGTTKYIPLPPGKLSKIMGKMQQACENQLPSQCECRSRSQPLLPEDFGNDRAFLDCRPGECVCPSGARHSVFTKDKELFFNMVKSVIAYQTQWRDGLKTACAGGPPNYCSCQRQPEKRLTSFNDLNEIFACRIDSCYCNGEEMKGIAAEYLDALKYAWDKMGAEAMRNLFSRWV